MNEETFWQIINLFDWQQKEPDKIIKPAVDALTKTTENDIFRFEEIMTEKLFSLDTPEYAKYTGKATYSENGNISTDLFLYGRCCVVANGKEFYETVLNTPKKFPENIGFSSMLKAIITTNNKSKWRNLYILEFR